jgi:hypothetical protein
MTLHSQLIVLLQGICAGAAGAIGLLFLRFWRESGERLFGYFAIGFWLMAINWTLLGLNNPTADNRPFIYVLRLLGFLLIIGGIIEKNLGPRR